MEVTELKGGEGHGSLPVIGADVCNIGTQISGECEIDRRGAEMPQEVPVSPALGPYIGTIYSNLQMHQYCTLLLTKIHTSLILFMESPFQLRMLSTFP